MRCESSNLVTWLVLTSVVTLVFSVGTSLAQERLDLKAGETNWVEPIFREGTRAVITTTPLPVVTSADMVDSLLNLPVPGISVQNIMFIGANPAGGVFGNALMPIGIDHGAILSSGRIASVVGGAAPPWNTSQQTSTNWGRPGDAMIGAISGFPTFDAARLQFEIRSDWDQLIVFRYVFGSECYDEWVGTQYNDGFVIWIDNTNVARIPPFVAAPPVTVNNVNGGNPWYLTNALSVRETELDGLTQHPAALPGGPGIPVRSVPYLLTGGTWHTVQIVIADASDHVWDSAAFIKGYFPSALGGCVLPNGECVTTSEGICEFFQGEYLGPGIECVTGACCLGWGCFETTESYCSSMGGTYLASGSNCAQVGSCINAPDPCYLTLQQCCPGVWQPEVCPGDHQVPVNPPTESAASTLVFVQSQPNPFNPEATLTYYLPTGGDVRLTVHDAQGRHIVTLVEQREEAGLHDVAWEGRDSQGHAVTSGVYFGRLEAAGQVKTCRLLLVQ